MTTTERGPIGLWALIALFVFVPGILPGAVGWGSTPPVCWAA